MPSKLKLDVRETNNIKVKFWIHISNGGDGSASALFFDSKEAAEKYASHDDERFCDDIYEKEIWVTPEGKLAEHNPKHWREK